MWSIQVINEIFCNLFFHKATTPPNSVWPHFKYPVATDSDATDLDAHYY